MVQCNSLHVEFGYFCHNRRVNRAQYVFIEPNECMTGMTFSLNQNNYKRRSGSGSPLHTRHSGGSCSKSQRAQKHGIKIMLIIIIIIIIIINRYGWGGEWERRRSVKGVYRMQQCNGDLCKCSV